MSNLEDDQYIAAIPAGQIVEMFGEITHLLWGMNHTLISRHPYVTKKEFVREFTVFVRKVEGLKDFVKSIPD